MSYLPYYMNASLMRCRIVLDGEMLAYDPLSQTVQPFGSLKTAALGQSVIEFAIISLISICFLADKSSDPNKPRPVCKPLLLLFCCVPSKLSM